MSTPFRWAAALAAGTAAILTVPAAAAAATVPAHRQTATFDCAGLGTVTIVETPQAAGDNWSAAQIVGDGHLVPVAFTYRVEDTTLGALLDQDTVTHPAAHPNQATTTCSHSMTATLGDLLPVPPNAQLPDDAAPSDQIELSFIVTAIAAPSTR
jgi:hypothetical protein